MSKILAIIAEYNPFHNGHLYHIQKSKSLINPDFSICIMSGNFCERGIPSIIDKWSKTEIALKNGFDLVIELPVVYSISSAENFAEGAIKILNAFDNVTLSFGSECGDLNVLQDIANVLYDEPKEFSTILSHELSKGLSYPKARENAILLYLNDIRKYSNILSNPNNTLGVEYLKAIKKLKSNVTPFTVQKIESSYKKLKFHDRLASATEIRNLIKKNQDVKKLIPISSFNILLDNINHGKIITDINIFEKEIIYTLRQMSVKEIADLQDVTEGLENLIKQTANNCNNLEDLINLIKSKRYTRTRIQRILLYALLKITKKDILNSYKTIPYIRVLGVSIKGKYLLSRFNNPKYTLITSIKNFMDTNTNKKYKKLIEKDILASNIYTLGYEYGSKSNLDYTKKLIVQ